MTPIPPLTPALDGTDLETLETALSLYLETLADQSKYNDPDDAQAEHQRQTEIEACHAVAAKLGFAIYL